MALKGTVGHPSIVAPHSFQDAAWVNVLAQAAGTYTSPVWGADRYNEILVLVTAANLTGTLDARLQTQMPDGTTYVDIAAITQIVANGSQFLNIVANSSATYAPTDGSLAAGTIKNGSLGRAIRIKYTVGTGPIDVTIQAMLLRQTR